MTGNWLGVGFLYLLGSALLIAELFLPAHGLLSLVGLGALGFALYETYAVNPNLALLCLIGLVILVPIGLVYSVKNWHRTPIGRRISPPNPKLSDRDRMPVEDLSRFIGRTGRSVTPLRPVGMCLFDGRRFECTTEGGMIPKDTEVEVIGLVDRTLAVRMTSSVAQADHT